MFSREWRTLRDIVLTERTHPLELLGGLSAIARGMWVIHYDGLVHGSPVAVYLEAWAPVPVWGAAVLLCGLWQVGALARASQLNRALASHCLAGLVGALLLGYALHDPQSIALPLYATMFVKQLWIGLRSQSPFNVERVFLVFRHAARTQ
jgi:hypothetical protein